MAISQAKLANKRHKKNLKRKNKKYVAPPTMAQLASAYDKKLKDNHNLVL